MPNKDFLQFMHFPCWLHRFGQSELSNYNKIKIEGTWIHYNYSQNIIIILIVPKVEDWNENVIVIAEVNIKILTLPII
jgi:hypothetical protein